MESIPSSLYTCGRVLGIISSTITRRPIIRIKTLKRLNSIPSATYIVTITITTYITICLVKRPPIHRCNMVLLPNEHAVSPCTYDNSYKGFAKGGSIPSFLILDPSEKLHLLSRDVDWKKEFEPTNNFR